MYQINPDLPGTGTCKEDDHLLDIGLLSGYLSDSERIELMSRSKLMILGFVGWDPPCKFAVMLDPTRLPVTPVRNLEPTCTKAKVFKQIGSNWERFDMATDTAGTMARQVARHYHCLSSKQIDHCIQDTLSSRLPRLVRAPKRPNHR